MATFAELQLGRVLIERGELASAESLLRRVQDEVIALESVTGAFEAALYLADCAIRKGEPEAALALLDKASEQAGDGRHDEALGFVDEGLVFARGRDLEYEVALLLFVKGDVLAADQPDRSEACRAGATSIFDRLEIQSDVLALEDA
jgi:tetratricopeptide (TPR) repeat protein